MNFSAAFSALFAKAKDEIGSADIKHRDWSSLRWLGLLALVGLVVYNATSHLLAEPALALIAQVFIWWMGFNTVTRVATIAMNAWSRVRLGEAFDKDGTITKEEKEIIGTVKVTTERSTAGFSAQPRQTALNLEAFNVPHQQHR